ncbi:MAG TPA: toxin [Blastocatellia bacterium]|nr:toxin [Blastocatellia bacterium]
MKTYAWNPEKNELLRKERGICFEDVVFHIEAGDAGEIFEHPKQEKYPGQQVIVVRVEEYVYLVPFVENDDEIFLKTIIPSRKATKKYLGDDNE